jgi:hypothetical protein
MAYTAASFITALSGLSITGVTRMFAYPPETVANADLPIAYVRLPELTNEAITLGSLPRIDNVQGELVVLIRADGLSMNTDNFSAMVGMIDNVNAALKTAAAASNRIDRWTIRQETAIVGESGFWALVATVEASG